MTVSVNELAARDLDAVDREILVLLDAHRGAVEGRAVPVRRVALEAYATAALTHPATAHELLHLLPSTPRNAVAHGLTRLRQRALVELTPEGFILSERGTAVASELDHEDVSPEEQWRRKAVRELVQSLLER